jgi:hypothetical protein
MLDMKLNKKSTEYDKTFINLRKWFLSKQRIDVVVDKLKRKIANKYS